MKDIRITVIKKQFDQELIHKYTPGERASSMRPCGMSECDSFVVSEPLMCPEGLCPWAWHDIESFVRIAAFDGKIKYSHPDNSWVRSCTDSFRPGTFLIEPLDTPAGS